MKFHQKAKIRSDRKNQGRPSFNSRSKMTADDVDEVSITRFIFTIHKHRILSYQEKY